MFQNNIYKLFNNDLKNLNNNQLQIHWNTIGKNEHRISNISHFFKKYPDFKLNVYKEKNMHLKKYDELIIMSHYHHNNPTNIINSNNSMNNSINNSINNSMNSMNNSMNSMNSMNSNYLSEYLNKYYIFNYNYCIIIIDYSNKINIENIKNYKEKIYLFTNRKDIYPNIKTNDITIINTDFDIYKINDLLINLNYDYYLFINNQNSEPQNIIDKNPSIIFHKDYTFIKQELLINYNFYTLITHDINELNINNKIYIDDNMNTYFINYKFYNLNTIFCDNYDTYKNYNKVYIDIELNNYNNLYYILKLISYLENKKYEVYLKKN